VSRFEIAMYANIAWNIIALCFVSVLLYKVSKL